MRIASFNVENLFSRVRTMNLESWSEGKEILAEYSRLNTILQEPVYTAANKQAILAAIERLGLNQDDDSEFVILRQNRGRLLKRPPSGPPEVVAEGRGDWIGWLELKREAVNEVAVEMTAKVIQDVNADILGVIEAEDRIALIRFSEQLLKPSCLIESIVSHVDDMENDNRIFSRDCPEFTVLVNETTRVLLLVNHLKSKGFGSKAESDAR